MDVLNCNLCCKSFEHMRHQQLAFEQCKVLEFIGLHYRKGNIEDGERVNFARANTLNFLCHLFIRKSTSIQLFSFLCLPTAYKWLLFRERFLFFAPSNGTAINKRIKLIYSYIICLNNSFGASATWALFGFRIIACNRNVVF